MGRYLPQEGRKLATHTIPLGVISRFSARDRRNTAPWSNVAQPTLHGFPLGPIGVRGAAVSREESRRLLPAAASDPRALTARPLWSGVLGAIRWDLAHIDNVQDRLVDATVCVEDRSSAERASPE